MKYIGMTAVATLAFAAMTAFASAADQAATGKQHAAEPAARVSIVSAQQPAKQDAVTNIQPQKKIVPSCTTVGILPAPAAGSPEAAPFYQWLIDWETVGSACRKSVF